MRGTDTRCSWWWGQLHHHWNLVSKKGVKNKKNKRKKKTHISLYSTVLRLRQNITHKSIFLRPLSRPEKNIVGFLSGNFSMYVRNQFWYSIEHLSRSGPEAVPCVAWSIHVPTMRLRWQNQHVVKVVVVLDRGYRVMAWLRLRHAHNESSRWHIPWGWGRRGRDKKKKKETTKTKNNIARALLLSLMFRVIHLYPRFLFSFFPT